MPASYGVLELDIGCTGAYIFPPTTSGRASDLSVVMFNSIDGSAYAAENVRPSTMKGEGVTYIRLDDVGWNVKVLVTIGWVVDDVT